MVDLSPSVLRARVTHARSAPVRNSFAYGVDYVLLDERQLVGGPMPRLFSLECRNLVSLYGSDHGFSGEGGTGWVRQIAADASIGEISNIALLTHPRYWGYVFNPVSFWFMTGPDGALKAVLVEVHNTFGDRHCYLCRSPQGDPIEPDEWVRADKRLHVSPFFAIEGSYSFRFAIEGASIGVWIRYDNGKGGGLFTALVGDRQPLTDGELLRALVRRPLGAAKTTALIHWQALKLCLKGVRYRNRPEPPREQIT